MVQPMTSTPEKRPVGETAARVSVVLPAWNRASLIGDAVRTVVEQSWSDWELLIVDDASTDDTVGAALAAAAGDPRVRLIRMESNGGPSLARNEAIRQARGEWVAFLDSDDVWEPAKLEKFLARSDEFRRERGRAPGVVYSWYHKTVDGRDSWTNRASAEGDVRVAILRYFFGIPSALMVRRDVLLEVGPLEHRWKGNEDYDLLLRLSRLTEFAVVPEVLSTIRLRTMAHHMSRNPDSYMAMVAKWGAEMKRVGARNRLAAVYMMAGRMYLAQGRRKRSVACAVRAVGALPSRDSLRFLAVSVLK